MEALLVHLMSHPSAADLALYLVWYGMKMDIYPFQTSLK